MVSLVLLGIGVAGAVLRPRGLPAWVMPMLAAAAGLASGADSLGSAHRAVSELADPLWFLLAAVPLALLLDRLGFFEALAGLLIGGPRLVPGLWILAAGVTTVLNLDAAVVLLTPLYVRVARRTGLSAPALAFQPVILALLASSALPVSNLTNLIAASHTGAGPLSFVVHLGPSSAAAVAVGYWCYRRALRPGVAEREPAGPTDRRALIIGGSVVAVVLALFLAGPSVGVVPWEVALAADAVLVVVTRWLPVRSIPWGTALVAASLAVLAAAAASHVPLSQVLSGSRPGDVATTAFVAAGGANVANNLPALLIALPFLGHGSSASLWAVLVGVNFGPCLLVTGSLASLLWLDASGRLGVEVSAGDYFRVGLKVGLPSLVVSVAVLVGVMAVLGPG